MFEYIDVSQGEYSAIIASALCNPAFMTQTALADLYSCTCSVRDRGGVTEKEVVPTAGKLLTLSPKAQNQTTRRIFVRAHTVLSMEAAESLCVS